MGGQHMRRMDVGGEEDMTSTPGSQAFDTSRLRVEERGWRKGKNDVGRTRWQCRRTRHASGRRMDGGRAGRRVQGEPMHETPNDMATYFDSSSSLPPRNVTRRAAICPVNA